ncbi:hypothetical protein CPB84DRAFT_1742552 [Gymnopilus junonius]|uniref:25S rRNA (uridine-N(3))-methyltransferase BMT5-like domain-containing protein n=1 Tax=Gymnopilus junonius TaxID=109634 RepID=A0A9P5NYX8_GYMJU|nr:hypothetical protein CPB84DRAFT_1742552 [Gymnopilus junonius]
MGKAGKNLKNALLSQQFRLKAKQKLSHAAQVAEQKSSRNSKGHYPSKASKGKEKTAASGSSSRPTIPFNPWDKILLIGEGNFSFARSLIQGPPTPLLSLPPNNITATAYDVEDECYAKYPESSGIVSFLRSQGVQVIFGVDGTRLEKHPKLKGRRWDRIVWNFPHAGKGIADQDRNILSNQLLVLGFLRSAAKMLQPGPSPSTLAFKKNKNTEDEDGDEDNVSVEPPDTDAAPFLLPTNTVKTRGTTLITLRNVAPYTQWDVPRLAKNPPLLKTGTNPPNPHYALLRSFRFHRDIWKGYEHRMTKGERAHGTGTTGEGGEDRTWEFYLKDQE